MTKQYECLNPDCPIYKRGENFDHPSCYDCPYKVINLSSIESNDTSKNIANESKKIKSKFATFQNDTLSHLENEEKRKIPKLLIMIAIPLLILLIAGSFLFFSMFNSGGSNGNSSHASSNSLSLMKDKNTELLTTISGSSTIGEKLMPALIKSYLTSIGGTNVSEIYNTKEKQLSVFFKLPDKEAIQEVRIIAKGSSTAFTSIEKKQCEIGMSSRKIKDEEDSKIAANGIDKLANTDNEIILGLDGESVIINNSNKINNLTKDQLTKIFTGKITNWSEVGGNSAKIKIYSRDEQSGSYDFFKSTIVKNDSFAKNITIVAGSQELSSKVSSDVNAIGYVGMGYIGSAKPVGISEGKTEFFLPTPFNIATEEYLLSRRLYLYAPPKRSNEFSKGFLKFVNTDEGQQVLNETDFISNNIFTMPIGQVPTRNLNDPDLKNLFDSIMSKAESRLSVNLRFQSNKTSLDEKSTGDLNRIVNFLNRSTYLNYKIALLGYTDSVGSTQSNIALSSNRAQFVYDELVKINAGLKDRIEVHGFGGEQPIATNETDEGKNKNRRVEVWLIKK